MKVRARAVMGASARMRERWEGAAEGSCVACHVGPGDERKVARRRCVDVVGHERVLTKAVKDGVARLLDT